MSKVSATVGKVGSGYFVHWRVNEPSDILPQDIVFALEEPYGHYNGQTEVEAIQVALMELADKVDAERQKRGIGQICGLDAFLSK